MVSDDTEEEMANSNYDSDHSKSGMLIKNFKNSNNNYC